MGFCSGDGGRFVENIFPVDWFIATLTLPTLVRPVLEALVNAVPPISVLPLKVIGLVLLLLAEDVIDFTYAEMLKSFVRDGVFGQLQAIIRNNPIYDNVRGNIRRHRIGHKNIFHAPYMLKGHVQYLMKENRLKMGLTLRLHKFSVEEQCLPIGGRGGNVLGDFVLSIEQQRPKKRRLF